MADITAQLIWYRLKENYESLALAYEQFSWRRVDILDMLFFGWILVAFLVIGLLNLYLRVFGLPKALQRRRGGRSIDGPGSLSNSGGLRDGETAQWINSVVGWFYENYPKKPAFVESWLKSLSDEAKKFSESDVQIRFDGIQSGSSPPHFTNVSTDALDKGAVTVLANMTCTDVTLLVSVVTKTATHMQTVGCQVRIAKLCGPVKVQYGSGTNPGCLQMCFYSEPELTLHASPNSYSNNIDQSQIESVVRRVINKVAFDFPFVNVEPRETILHHQNQLLSSQSSGITDRTSSRARGRISDDSLKAAAAAAANVAMETAANETAGTQKLNSGFVHPSPKTDYMDSQTSCGFRLLVKLIKANGLMDKDFTSCDPYCMVSADEPVQQHSTSVVKNTVNPFFDEYFLLDVTNGTKLIKFEVFDRSKATGDDLLGQASVAMDDLRRLPSSRQIIPLIGRPKAAATTTTSGSVTVEFLFLESNESAKTSALEPSPPRRRIEMNRSLMPGGMTVTTKTTTTEKLRDQRDDPMKYTDSPTRVEKAETVSSYASDSSPYMSGTSSRGGVPSSTPSTSQDQILTNGLDSVAETALRQLSRQPNVPSQSATIVITGVQKEKSIPVVKEPLLPILKMTKPGNTKPSKDTSSQGGTDNPVETKKKSFASALKKRFSRHKKSRSQSADRAQTFRDEGYLRPPEQGDTTLSDQSEFAEGNLRKSRSHSFSSSFRNLFRRKKKSNMSRESSFSRISARGGADMSREDSTAHPSPQLSHSKGSSSGRHNTPASELSPTTGYRYSTSVPARPSPLYDH